MPGSVAPAGIPAKPRRRVRAPTVAPSAAAAAAGSSRFRIFIIDCGWNSPARRASHDNFDLSRDLNNGMRPRLRQEGLQGAFEIILPAEAQGVSI